MKTPSFAASLLLACAASAALPARSQFPAFHTEEAAAARKDPPMYTIDAATIRIEKIRPAAGRAAAKPPRIDAGQTAALPSLDEIVNVGRKVWQIIDENKPVADVKSQFATALPKGVKAWTDMAGWRAPEGTVYELSAKNVYGMTVVRVRYQVLRTCGGSFNGKGRYLTAVAVEPLLVEVGWGYRFSMEASVPDTSIVNAGTASDPVAGMTATLSWRISTPLKDAQGEGLYFLRGDGVFREIGGPFSARSLEKAKGKIPSESGQGAGRSATMGS